MTPADLSTAIQDPERQLLDRALVTAFLDNVPDNVYFKDRESRFIAVSKSKARRHHLEPADLIGKTDFELFSDAHARSAFEDEQRIIRTGEPIVGQLEKETWPDGRVTWVLTSKVPLRNDQGEIVGTFGIGKDVTKSKGMELALEQARKDLIDASRAAGMAEVATGVLHNVGNVLNSLNVSAAVIGSGLRQSKAESLAKVSAMLGEHAADPGDFLTNDPKGRLVPAFLESLARHLVEENARLLQEVESLRKNIDHINEIVSMQQAYATTIPLVEPLEAKRLMEDSLRMNTGALERHAVCVVREYEEVPPILAEKGKVLQILVNLIRNAKYACDEGSSTDKSITLRVASGAAGRVHLVVSDNGVGIPAENLTRIFAHGFTTRAKGHGFGLHASALAAKEMKGTLTVHSDGPGTGAAFVLDLPAADAATPA
jgi:PAS domain S-box-containing protein